MALRRSGPRRETAGEVGARQTILERKMAEFEQRLNLLEGNARNMQSAIDDMRLNDKGLLHEAYEYRSVFEHFRDSGFKALVSAFRKELREERRQLAILIQSGAEED